MIQLYSWFTPDKIFQLRDDLKDEVQTKEHGSEGWLVHGTGDER